ncbi:hypothetical protein [Spirosoma spitsbergense]|uniref:hypothetical protein n=1 Tax=Spirosoma spitsbergense TaxID=431554 RepID=UPI00036986ED|nr:hypothetical protein [Spirosoma spitsbergense]
MKKTETTAAQTADLNDYHKERNRRMVKKTSEQPLMSPDEFIEQTRRLARQSTQTTVKSGD